MLLFPFVSIQDAVTLKAANDRAQEELKKLKTVEKNVKASREKVMKEMESEMKAAAKVSTALKAEATVGVG